MALLLTKAKVGRGADGMNFAVGSILTKSGIVYEVITIFPR